jgi:hypothetical protein
MVASGEERLWTALLVSGAVAATVFLVLQMVDFVEDAGRPAMRQNDMYSALGSVAMLAIVGVIAARRAQLRREALGLGPSGKRAAKRSGGRARRRGRA